MVSSLYEACVRADYEAARPLQYRVRRMLRVVMHNYPSTIKYCMALMDRPVGVTRRPIRPPTTEETAWVKRELEALGVFATEPHGWSVGTKAAGAGRVEAAP
jgi:dihydrodipicolinate synthase/N-acetylneuraminate lyase